MLEPPDLATETIVSRLREAYGRQAVRLDFLPLGVDVNAAVYRAVMDDGETCFLKLRKGPFERITVDLPAFLHQQGIHQIIPPLATKTGQRWAGFGSYKMILYPFIEGQDGYRVALSNRQWLEFGAALQAIHTIRLPEKLQRQIPHEDFSPRWRESVRAFQAQAENQVFTDPVAMELARFMRENWEVISRLVERAERLAASLKERSLPPVLCHADLHAGNLLIGADGSLYIVDWDNPALAPRERDLMHIGGSSTWNQPEWAALFYRGYEPVEVDGMALAYYRAERIIQDIAAYCEQLFLSEEGGEDRQQSLFYFTGQFLPGHEVDIANRTGFSG